MSPRVRTWEGGGGGGGVAMSTNIVINEGGQQREAGAWPNRKGLSSDGRNSIAGAYQDGGRRGTGYCFRVCAVQGVCLLHDGRIQGPLDDDLTPGGLTKKRVAAPKTSAFWEQGRPQS